MSEYEFTSDPNTIRRTSDGAFIPADERNYDYRAYLSWKEEGNEPDPAPILPVQPSPLSVDDLAAILVAKKILTPEDIKQR